MAKWLITEKNSNQRHCRSLKGQGLAQLIVLASYLSDFTHKITECNKQELTSYMCNITYPKFPCRICIKNVSDKDKAVQCDLCELWVHIKCNNLNYLDYRYLQNSDKSWYCTECCSTNFPFNSLSSNKNFLACCTNIDINSTH